MSKDKNTEALSKNVISNCDGYWEWFDRSHIPVAPYEITGKYLFFALNRELLIDVVKEELENGGFHHAKIPMADITPPSGEYVLCLYYKDNSRKHELAEKYRDRCELKYRYWKSDSDTISGKYSKQFLNELSPDYQKIFQRKQGK